MVTHLMAVRGGSAKRLARGVVLALVAALMAVAPQASARVISVVRVSSPSPFPIGDCRPDDAAVNDVAFPNEPGNDSHPTVAINPRDPKNIVAAFATDSYGVVAASSFDGGRTWRRSVVTGVTKCTGGTLNHPAFPRLAFGPDGRLYLSVTAITSGFPTPGAFLSNVGVATSPDGGRTWAPPVWLLALPAAARSQMIVAEPVAGAAVVTWHAPQPVAASYLSRTADGGRTWTTHVLPNRPGQFQPFLTPLATRDGRLHVFLSNQPVPLVVEQANTAAGNPLDLRADLFVVHSEDKGANWTAPEPVVGATLPDWSSAVEGADGTIHVAAWRDTDAMRRDFFVVRSTDGGATWSEPSIVAHDVLAPVPRLAMDARGVLGVSYLTPVGDLQRVVFATSIDNGTTWSHEHVAEPFQWVNQGEVAHQETAAGRTGFATAFVRGGPDTDGATDVFVAIVR